MKKLFIVSAIAAIATGSSAAFGAVMETPEAPQDGEVSQQLVTVPTEVIDSPVKVVTIVSGPIVKPQMVTGPIVRVDPPELGTLEWMAQEKAEKAKLKTDAQLKQEALEAEAARVQAELEAEIARLESIAWNTETLNQTLELVKQRIGKTPWYFSGSTPSAWDCSGMVRWTYAHLGIDLEHRASIQRASGTIVTEPKIGDLVSFNYKGSTRANHIGIYVGPDQMIHAGGKPGDRTEIRSISGWAKGNSNSEIVYTRIVETNN